MSVEGLIQRNKFAEIGGQGQEVSVPRQMSLRERLMQKKRHIESELTNTEAALAALDKNPDIENVLELLGRAI